MTPASEINADVVIERLQRAFLTMAAMPGGVGPRALGAHSYGYVPEPDPKASSVLMGGNRATASGSDITGMDEAMQWLNLIQNRTTRQVVATRSIVHRDTGKALMTWRHIGKRMNCSHVAALGWYAAGIDLIVTKLTVGK